MHIHRLHRRAGLQAGSLRLAHTVLRRSRWWLTVMSTTILQRLYSTVNQNAAFIGPTSAAGSVGGVNPGRRACFLGGSERDPHQVHGACRAGWVVPIAVRPATGRSGRLWGEETCGVLGRRQALSS